VKINFIIYKRKKKEKRKTTEKIILLGVNPFAGKIPLGEACRSHLIV